MRQDQLEWLESTRKSLNRAKGSGVGERLTDNTLVRVALDLLRSRSEALAGTTEAELRASVGLSESS
ncbi:hypothetical protein HQQ81_20940 [Microbacteriaceae bacterium VKM Ac-2854]|nr:hypothetical protein [Microbacteriaceae bacterium VKM Ac-2854]